MGGLHPVIERLIKLFKGMSKASTILSIGIPDFFVGQMKIIITDLNECGACHICETACSLTKAGECNPAKSRIKIVRGEMMESIAICRQCEFLYCASVCPKDAIHREADTGVVIVDHTLCNGCRKCVAACPFKAIFFDRDTKKALICDHCRGNPQCVEWCPREALVYTELNDQTKYLRTRGAEGSFAVLDKIGR